MTDPGAIDLTSVSSSFAGLVSRTAPAIVSVHSHRSRASGFLWKAGLVVTADEALADEGEVSIKLADGSEHAATIAGRDHTTDVALLRFDGKDLPSIRLDPVTMPATGALALVVAADRGIPTASLAMVSLVGPAWRSLRGGEIDARVELDVRLRHSQQGGLAVDASGQPIGMAVLGPRRVLVIPAATIARVAESLETKGRISRGYLGVGLQPVRLDDGVGAMVMSVDRNGPAAAAGIKQGDVIVGLNAEKLSSVRSLARALGPDSVGSVIDIALQRAGEPMNLNVTVGERPQA
jgi:S1-C subfamily serine protease